MSAALVGSPLPGARLNRPSMPLPPRFEISKSSAPLPLLGSTGCRTKRSAEKCTLPSAALAACARSTIGRLCRFAGSIANSTVPTSFSYGPVLPNVCPSATGVRLVMVTFVTSALTRVGTATTQATSVAISHRTKSLMGVLQRAKYAGRSGETQPARLRSCRPRSTSRSRGGPVATARITPRIDTLDIDISSARA